MTKKSIPQTLVEKILSNGSGKKVYSGDSIEADYNALMAHDGLVSSVFDEFKRLEKEKGAEIAFPDRLRFYTDHFAPAAPTTGKGGHTKRTNIQKKFLDFAKEYGIEANIYQGICHSMLIDDEEIMAGDIVLGADSHTTTAGAVGAFATGIGSTDFLYAMIRGKLWLHVPESIKVELTGTVPEHIYGKDIILELLGRIGEEGAVYDCLEFHDLTTNKIPMDGRSAISNMSVETGAMAGIFVPDERTKLFYMFSTSKSYNSKPKYITPDEDANYKEVIKIDVTNLDQKIAKPHSPANVVSIDDVVGTKVDQVFIGSCTGGRLADLEIAYNVFSKYLKLADGLKVIIIPATTRIYREANDLGYIDEFLDKGAAVCTPSCGPCANIDKGLLADGEVAISTSNRNFQGRMGSKHSSVYLSSALAAAEAAVHGEIVKHEK